MLLEDISVSLDLLGVAILEFGEGLGILLLGLEEIFVPLLIKLLVLLDMGLLALFSLEVLSHEHLLVPPLVVLGLELSHSVLGHLSLNIFTLQFTSLSVILENTTIKCVKTKVSLIVLLIFSIELT